MTNTEPLIPAELVNAAWFSDPVAPESRRDFFQVGTEILIDRVPSFRDSIVHAVLASDPHMAAALPFWRVEVL